MTIENWWMSEDGLMVEDGSAVDRWVESKRRVDWLKIGLVERGLMIESHLLVELLKCVHTELCGCVDVLMCLKINCTPPSCKLFT